MAREYTPVGGDLDTIGIAEARSVLAWWLEAGVDVAVQEEPRNWLRPTPPPSKRTTDTPPQQNVVQPSQETLAELKDWLATSVQLPLAGPGAKRVLPHGPENAAIMLLTDSPSVEDAAAGQPIGGESLRPGRHTAVAIFAKIDSHPASVSITVVGRINLPPRSGKFRVRLRLPLRTRVHRYAC